MKDIAIYGAGGFGREVACLIQKINEINETPIWNFIGFFDDGVNATNDYPYGPVLGNLETLNKWDKPISIAIAIGTPRIINKLVDSINNEHVSYPNLISPDTKFLDRDTCILGYGNIICTGCLLSCNTKIGNFNQFNGFITLGHDSHIGNFNSFMPGVRISGGVQIGNRTFWGLNSGIVQYKTVCNDVVVGAGSVLMRSANKASTYLGIPANSLLIPKV